MFELFTEAKKIVDAFVSSYPLKWLLGGASWLLIELVQAKHTQIFGVFIMLVLYDLITKWAAIAYKMLIDKGASPESIYLLDKYKAIPVAFNEGLICSKYMKKGFVNKLFMYVTATILAVLFDHIIEGSGYPPFVLNLVWIYLGGSEVLSILENMRDGGNKTMGIFLETIKVQIEKKLGIKVQ